MSGRVIPKPDGSADRTITRSRVLSYALVVLAAVVFSLRPELFGDPQTQPAHALLHGWRIVAGIVLGVAALAVQVVVGVRWRAGLRREAGVDSKVDGEVGRKPPGNRAPRDR
ncbi:hypothetical protein EDF64_10168 [Curtobacterium flaccumfaciens]|uniref:Uncharacterized protein n=1 Tax=Curtobacterium flaccumfaciens TaxID=2035 RepID=A0A4R6DMU4_9MICO|nr:hypothetical protein [Curtobacterium flaccumfaciens]TDN46211.1 hypothetical protein EDF64_10168 [Curtobacterium flaccumfaciens]